MTLAFAAGTPATGGTTVREFAAALDACHDGASPGGLVASAEGWVIASAARLPGGHPMPGGSDALAAACPGAPSPVAAREAFADALLRLQRGALGQVLGQAVIRLEGRSSEGANLLNRQLVRGDVADVALALSEADDLLGLPVPGPERRWRVHRHLVTTGRTLIKLYGASGFVDDGPGRVVYLLEVLGNTYLHPGHRRAETEHD